MREQTIHAMRALKAIKAMQAVQGEPNLKDSPAANEYNEKEESGSEASAESASEVSVKNGAGGAAMAMEPEAAQKGVQAKSVSQGDKAQHGTGGAGVPAAGGTHERRLDPAFDLAPYLRGWTLVSTSLGHDGHVYVLLIDGEPVREAGFVPSGLETAPRYKVLVVGLRSTARSAAQGVVEEIGIEGESFNYHYVQPLGADLLLVGARSRYTAATSTT